MFDIIIISCIFFLLNYIIKSYYNLDLINIINREINFRKLEKIIQKFKLENGPVFIINNKKCKCKKFNYNLKCSYCRLNISVNIESLKSWMNKLKFLNKNENIHLIIHTKGGNSTYSDGVIKILFDNFKNINVYVPEYAFSAGTMFVLTSNKIYLNWYSMTGPVDSQLSYDTGDLEMNCSTNYLKNIKDIKWCENSKDFIQSSLAQLYYNETKSDLEYVLKNNPKKDLIIKNMLETKFSHDYVFSKKDLSNFGLPVESSDVPFHISNLFYSYYSIS